MLNPPTFGDRYLTTTNNVDSAETRAQGGNFQYPSQDWVIEHVPGGNTVRLRDIWSGKYLTAVSTSPYFAPILSQSLSNQNWASQRWLVQ